MNTGFAPDATFFLRSGDKFFLTKFFEKNGGGGGDYMNKYLFLLLTFFIDCQNIFIAVTAF